MQRAERLRLLILTDTAILGPGGSERFLRNLLERLPPERYAIDLLQLAPEPAPEQRVARLENPAVALLHEPIDAIYGRRALTAFAAIRRRVLRGDYDVVQSQHEKSDLISAALPRRHVRKISNRRDMGFQKSAKVRALFRHVNGRFDRIVAPTGSIIDALVAQENVERTHCRTIPNGVDMQRFRPADADTRAALRRALGFDAGARLVGCVASFTPVKRHVDLLAAFAQVRARLPDAHLLLIGDGPLRADLERQIAALDLGAAVHLLGARSEVERILPALDAFVLASSTEGLSNAILEAQACGLAVAATRVGGNPDLVRENDSGLLVPALAPDALAQALIALLEDRARAAEFGRRARARVEAQHSLEAMAAAYETVYRELAA